MSMMFTNTETLKLAVYRDMEYNAHSQIFRVTKRWYIDIISIAEVDRELRPENSRKILHEFDTKIRAEIRK